MVVGPTEAIFILGGLLLLFGPDKIPEVARSLGEAAKRFKEGLSETKATITEQSSEVVKPVTDEEMVFQYAKDLGINIKNKDLDEIAKEILNMTETGT